MASVSTLATSFNPQTTQKSALNVAHAQI